MPARSLSFPLIMGGTCTPMPLLTGGVDLAGRNSDRAPVAWEPIEALAFRHVDLMENLVREKLAAGHDRDVSHVIDEWVTATTAAHLAVLRH